MYGSQPGLASIPLYGTALPGGARGPASVKGTTGRGQPQFTEGKLFLGGVDRSVSKHAIDEYCSKWGEVADSVVMDNKGYGFVTFKDPKDAMKFLETRDHVIAGKKVDVKAAVPKSAGGNAKLTKKLFVGGTGQLSDEEFHTHFSQFGAVEDAAIVRKEGLSRGFGFVTFADEISVEKCLVVQHFISGRKVEIKRAVPKEAMPPGGYPAPIPGFPGAAAGPSGMERGMYGAGRGMPYGPMAHMDPYYAMAAGGYAPYAPYGYAMPMPGYAPYGGYTELPPGYMAMPASPQHQPHERPQHERPPLVLMPPPLMQQPPQQQQAQQQQQQQQQQAQQAGVQPPAGPLPSAQQPGPQQPGPKQPAAQPPVGLPPHQQHMMPGLGMVMPRGGSGGSLVVPGNAAGRQRGPSSVVPQPTAA